MAEAKKATKKAAPRKKLSPMDELMKAVEKAQKAGLEVRVYAACVNGDGITDERTV